MFNKSPSTISINLKEKLRLNERITQTLDSIEAQIDSHYN